MLLSSQMIAGWCRTGRFLKPPCDDRHNARHQADVIWRALRERDVSQLVPVVGEVAYALRELVLEQPVTAVDSAESIAAAFSLVSREKWPDSLFAEREEILADIAYKVAACYRSRHDYKSMRLWEDECVRQIRRVEPAKSYLTAFAQVSSASLDRAFLETPPVLLAVCRCLEAERNQEPGEVLELASRAFRVVRDLEGKLLPDDHGYLAGDLALSAAAAAAHLGRLDEMAGWLQAADFYYGRTYAAALFESQVEGLRALLLNLMQRYTDALELLDPVIDKLEQTGMDANAFSARLLKGVQLKNLGRHPECITCLEAALAKYPRADDLRRGFAFAHLADAKAESGRLDDAIIELRKAVPLLARSGSVLGVATLQTFVGQFLRVGGNSRPAVTALRAAAETYSKMGSTFFEGYSRILMAETLITLGSNQEATLELLRAIPLLESTGVDAQMMATLRLLRAAARESMARLKDIRKVRHRLLRRGKSG